MFCCVSNQTIGLGIHLIPPRVSRGGWLGNVKFRQEKICALRKAVKNSACKVFGSALLVNHMVNCSSRLLNRTFAALADPTRRRILESLAQGDRCVTDLARPHAMSLPAVSKHL